MAKYRDIADAIREKIKSGEYTAGQKLPYEYLLCVNYHCNKETMKNFLKTIEIRIKQGYSITIFPEAHIWPYYTKIRPFKSVSFKYPVKLETPVFCMTNTYQCYGKNNEKVRIVSYIDGPFFSDKELNLKEQQEDLRNKVYDVMVERSKNSNIEVIKYQKKRD